MLDILLVILILAWLGGWLGFGGFGMGSLIHFLLVLAVVVLVYRVLAGRRPL
jgi:hypothetical protein